MKRNRYPGLRSFEEEDEKLFFGRDKESAQLASIIYSERFVVLFGSSGVGKSSLLNTLYKKQNELLNAFHPIRVRIQANQITDDGKKVSPFEIVKNELKAFFGKRNIPFDTADMLFDAREPRLWEWIKLAEVVQAKHGLMVQFVLVFDQFEEYFLLPTEVQDDFSCQLAEVMHEQSPARVLDWMAGIKDEDRTADQFQWYSQVGTKVIFSMRSDKLYYLGGMVNYIPGILRSRMELQAFDDDNAKEAIEGPAKTEGEFQSPKIEYLGNIADKITAAVMDEAQEVDSTLLQVICYSVEQFVISKQLNPNTTYLLSETEFDKEINLDQILDNFYMTQTELFKDSATIELVRSVIENNLVEKGERIALSRQQFINRLGNAELIPKLLEYRLIREEQSAGNVIKYELIHDKLIATVQRRRNIRDDKVEFEREAKRATRRLFMWSFGILFLLAIIAAGIFYFRAGSSINNRLVELADDEYINSNHFLAYSLIDELNTNWYSRSKIEEAKIEDFKHRFLYDISARDKIERINDSTFAAFNTGNICIWRANKKSFAGEGKLDLIAILPRALNIIVSKVGEYVAFRDFSGSVNVYDVKQKKLRIIKKSKVKLSTINYDGFNEDDIVDYKMAFLENSSWLAFIDSGQNFRLYNAETNFQPNYLFLRVGNEYRSSDVSDFFFYSPGSNFIATRKPNDSIVRIRDMGEKQNATKKDTVPNVLQFLPTSRNAEFAYLTQNHEFYSILIDKKYINHSKSSKFISANVKRIIPLKDHSKAILLSDNGLRVYDFEKGGFDAGFDLNDRFFRRLQGYEKGLDSRSLRWSELGKLLLFVDKSIIVDFDKAQSFPMFPPNEIPSVFDSQNNKCIISEVDDNNKRLAYINQNGNLILKRIDSQEIEKSWLILTGKSAYNYQLDQLCRFSSSGRYFAFISPEKKTERLTIVDLKTGDQTVKKFKAQTIGDYFLDEKYIHIINKLNTGGGLIFLNGKKRNNNYYSKIFPQLTPEQKDSININ